MYKINFDKFSHTQWELMGRVQTAQQTSGEYATPTKVTFNSGWFREQEWYKREVWEKAQGILQHDTWREEHIHTYDLIGRIAQCMDIPMGTGKKQNLLDWRETADEGENSLKGLLSQNRELSEILIYQIFCGDNEELAFRDAMEAWGARFPFLSFLFYLKDIRRFVPVRPDRMKKGFQKLGIESDCLRTCSWENYQEFLMILQEIQSILKASVDPETELIDAHSFLWATWFLDEAKVKADPLSLEIEKIEETIPDEVVGGVRDAVVKVRVNQSVFRDRLLQRYNRCCLCGVSAPELLVASHIRPWSVSNKSEKIDVDNGLLLCPNHDQLFDGGWITFAEDGKIMISKQLSKNDRVFTNVQDRLYVDLTEGNKEYMAYHRENIFRDRPTKNEIM